MAKKAKSRPARVAVGQSSAHGDRAEYAYESEPARPPSAPMCTPGSRGEFVRGGNQRVEISGVQSRSDLNGRTAIASSWDAAKGRYVVDLLGGEKILLKPANLAPANPTAKLSDAEHLLDDAERKEQDDSRLAECPICLQLLVRPVTLSCGHNFCQSCIVTALHAASERCPTCRAPVPAGAKLEPNQLLSSLVRAVNPDRYDELLAQLGPAPEADAPVSATERLAWTLHVDYLSPASLIVLCVAKAIDAPLSGLGGAGSRAAVAERPMRWCDDRRRPEWDKDTEGESVPCLYGAAEPGESPLVTLLDPHAIVSTLLATWGGGRLRPPRSAGPVALASHDELVMQAWTKLVKPVSLHLFSCAWDGMCSKPGLADLVRALEWVAARVARRGPFPEADRMTLLDVCLGVPCALLVTCGSKVVQDAAEAMPSFRAWVQGAVHSLRVDAVASRSATLSVYRKKLKGAEHMPMLFNSRGGFDAMLGLMQARSGGGAAPASKPPRLVKWPCAHASSYYICPLATLYATRTLG